MLGFRYTNFGECLNILRCRAFPTSTPYIQFLVVLKGIISLFSKYIEYLLKRCYPSPTYRGWEIFTLFVKYVTEKYKETVRDFNDLADRYNNNLEKIDSLEKENKSLKNEIKGIYKGFKAFFKDSKQVTTEQAKTLVGGVVDKVKEFVKGGEFEKIHRNETQTRDRDELSR